MRFSHVSDNDFTPNTYYEYTEEQVCVCVCCVRERTKEKK